MTKLPLWAFPHLCRGALRSLPAPDSGTVYLSPSRRLSSFCGSKFFDDFPKKVHEWQGFKTLCKYKTILFFSYIKYSVEQLFFIIVYYMFILESSCVTDLKRKLWKRAFQNDFQWESSTLVILKVVIVYAFPVEKTKSVFLFFFSFFLFEEK